MINYSLNIKDEDKKLFCILYVKEKVRYYEKKFVEIKNKKEMNKPIASVDMSTAQKNIIFKKIAINFSIFIYIVSEK